MKKGQIRARIAHLEADYKSQKSAHMKVCVIADMVELAQYILEQELEESYDYIEGMLMWSEHAIGEVQPMLDDYETLMELESLEECVNDMYCEIY